MRGSNTRGPGGRGYHNITSDRPVSSIQQQQQQQQQHLTTNGSSTNNPNSTIATNNTYRGTGAPVRQQQQQLSQQQQQQQQLSQQQQQQQQRDTIPQTATTRSQSLSITASQQQISSPKSTATSASAAVSSRVTGPPPINSPTSSSSIRKQQQQQQKVSHYYDGPMPSPSVHVVASNPSQSTSYGSQQQQQPGVSSNSGGGAVGGSGSGIAMTNPRALSPRSGGGGNSNNNNHTTMPPPPPPPPSTQQSQHHQQLVTTTSSIPLLPQQNQLMISVESPLPTSIQRGLGDRSNEKRKNAALEIELLIKQEANNFPMIASVIAVLSKDFCTSMNSNYRKGGLVGLAATAIGLLGNAPAYLQALLPPVLHCFDDPESRVRYYACEALYNIAKVSRQSILKIYFNPIFDGLAKLYADVDVDVKNGANLLDRLIKDIVTEAGEEGTFHIDQFLPLLQNYIRRTNPYIRQLIVGWITLLDSIPDISMLDYLPDFLDGLFNMLSDTNREIRQAADSALSDFLRELSVSSVLEFGPIISILVFQCSSKERLNRLTAITWLAELTHHPRSGGDALLAYHADVLGAIMCCISDDEKEIRLVAERTNDDLLILVKEQTGASFALRPILGTLITELLNKPDVPTKMASLRWINMLMEKRPSDMNVFTNKLLPVLLKTLSDPSDAVILLTLQVLSRISLSKKPITVDNDDTVTVGDPFDAAANQASNNDSALSPKKDKNNDGIDGSKKNEVEQNNTKADSDIDEAAGTESQCQLVLTAILRLFAQDRKLLETRGSLIIRKLCVLLNARTVYIIMSNTLASYELSLSDVSGKSDMSTPVPGSSSASSSLPVSADYQNSSLQFISTMVQTMNLILLTASELHDLRSVLASSFESEEDTDTINNSKTVANRRGVANNNNSIQDSTISTDSSMNDCTVFATLYHCWCHNPVATFSLCLLARAYDLSFALVQKFSDMDDVSVGFLMQIDKLVHLLESPIFFCLRLQLLNVEASYHEPLLKSIYGVLMCLPQGDAYRLLNERLATVCNLRDSLGSGGYGHNGINSMNNNSTNANFGYTGSGRGYEHHTTDTSTDSRSTIVGKKGLDMKKLLDRYDVVVEQHKDAKNRLPFPNPLENTTAVYQQHPHTSNNIPSDSSGKQFQQDNNNNNIHQTPHPADYMLSPSNNNHNGGATRISALQQQQQQHNSTTIGQGNLHHPITSGTMVPSGSRGVQNPVQSSAVSRKN